mgnify:FL=1
MGIRETDYEKITMYLQCAELRNRDDTLSVIWNHHNLEKLMEIFGNAEEEKGFSLANANMTTLVLRATDGTIVEAVMLRNAPKVEINGMFYNYDPDGEGKYTAEDILNLFGLSEMPQ